MKLLLAAAALVGALVLVGDAFAQGACSRTCTTAHSQCQREVSQAGAACIRACGGRARCVAACEKRQQAIAAECSRRHQLCLRSCRGR